MQILFSIIFKEMLCAYLPIRVMVIDIGTVVLGFDSRAGQIGRSVANSSLSLRRNNMRNNEGLIFLCFCA